MTNKSRLTYSNVVSTLALFLALSGGVAFAASKIHTNDIFKRAVTSGKLALGAVRSNQIADGAVSAKQVADGAIGTKQIADGAISAGQIAGGAVGAKQIADGTVTAKQIANATIGANQIGAGAVAPSNLQFPVYFAASPTGGSLPVPSGESVPYPVSDSTWLQKPGQLNVLFGGAAGTLARDENSGEACRVFFEIRVNGRQTGGGELSTNSTSPEQVEQQCRRLAGNRSARSDHQQTGRQRQLQRGLHAKLDRRLDPLPRPRFRLSQAPIRPFPLTPERSAFRGL